MPGQVRGHGSARPPARLVPALVLVVLLAVPTGPWAQPARAGPFDGRFMGYRVENATFGLVELDAPTGLDMPIDNMTAQLDLGFETRLFNDPTANFWVGSNGFISLFKKEDPGCCEGQSLPSGADPDGIIAGLWAHFDPTRGGNISFQSFASLARPGLDAQPGAVARWKDLPFANATGDATFEVVLLANGVFEVHVDHAVTPPGMAGTIGAEDFNGSRAAQVAHGALDLLHQAWRFTPLYELLIPDLVVASVRVAPPTLPTDAWTVTVHVVNDGTGNFLQAQVQLLATPLPGPLRGTSPGCPALVGTKTMFGFDPGATADLRYFWAPPVDPNNPSAPRVGGYRFDATGVVLQAAEPERNTTNNAASAAGSFLVTNVGGTDLLCSRLPDIPGIGQARLRDGGP
ncbi:MAG: hypothetical protein LC624_09390 [Halobacteriales archaeon]|nr:hypothetical protein [Halobacteriales archaeon]